MMRIFVSNTSHYRTSKCIHISFFLAHQIWDLAQNKRNPSDFATAIDESELGSFNFTDEFIFDLWAAIEDIQVGRVTVPEPTNFSERL